jgi:HTH-type transcriptional regulator / antitoxin HigA
MLRDMLKRRGWTYEDLSQVIGRSVRAISAIATGGGITPDMAACLSAAFGNTAEEWLQAEASYRLSLVTTSTSEIQQRAALFSRAPIREMQKRGWIKDIDDVDLLNKELDRFFGNGQADSKFLFVATRRSDKAPMLTNAEAAWCYRAKQIASTLLAAPFNGERISKARQELRRLAAHPKAALHLPKLLGDYGVRFVVIEPLLGVKIDGAALWDDIGPIMAVSLRHDRVDGFWFTVFHEWSHIRHGDPDSVDRAMIDPEDGVLARLAGEEFEHRADQEAAESLIPTEEIESFISRVGPLYSKTKIIQFANRIRIHPGIIVGQLQHRGEIGYRSNREQLVKIRDFVTSTALTDGWGHEISPSLRG